MPGKIELSLLSLLLTKLQKELPFTLVLKQPVVRFEVKQAGWKPVTESQNIVEALLERIATDFEYSKHENIHAKSMHDHWG